MSFTVSNRARILLALAITFAAPIAISAQAGKLPPLIDRELFFGNPEISGAQISPVTSIDHRQIGEGKIGPLADRVRAVFQDVVRGRNARYRSWLAPVYRSAAQVAAATKTENSSTRAR